MHRRNILELRNDLCRKEVSKGKTKPPYYYILPLTQHDQSELVNLVNLLIEHGVYVYQLAKPFFFDGRPFDSGDIVIPLSQPFRAFIKEVMEQQKYPVRHYTPGGEIIKPYDVTSWSLPLHRGVKAVDIVIAPSEGFESSFEEIKGILNLKKEVAENFWAAVFSVNNNESFKAAFYAQKLGLKVDRLNTTINIGSAKAPKGSFVVHNDPEKSSEMKQLLNEMYVSPMIMKDPIEIEAMAIKMPKIALIETYFHDADAGWARFIFDTYFVPYKIVHPSDFEKTDFTKSFDVVVFPDSAKSILMQGKWKVGENEQYAISSYPPEYTKGIGKKGMEQLMTFLDSGGIIVSWGQSTELFLGMEQLMTFLDSGGIIVSWGQSTELFLGTHEINRGKKGKEEFQLPVRDMSKMLKASGLFCPGSLVKILLKNNHPITLGMPKEIGVLFDGGPVFSTSIPDFDMDRRVIGKFPERNILLSGYCEKEEKISNRTAAVWLKTCLASILCSGHPLKFRLSCCSTQFFYLQSKKNYEIHLVHPS
jgi:hypothetical protein